MVYRRLVDRRLWASSEQCLTVRDSLLPAKHHYRQLRALRRCL